MRNRKLILLLFVLITLFYCSQALATDPSYLAANWKQYENATATIELGFSSLSPNILGNNCFGFASLVVKHMNNVEVRYYSNVDYRILLAGSRTGSYLGDGRYITANEVKNEFANARIGDWIQMVCKYQHSAIISDLDANGFEVLHANWPSGQITNKHFTYEEFANECRNGCSAGGFTINHFGDPISQVPDLTWDGPAILTNNGEDQIKTYTLEYKRYIVYSDKELEHPLSSTAWTGEDDEVWILAVGKNSKGEYYARISYPTPNGRKVGYVNLNIFVAGWENKSATIYKDCNDFYRRRGSGKDTSYWARIADGAIFPLKIDSQWVQVLFWDSGDNGGRRIAWLTRSKYDEITRKPYTVNPPVIQGTTYFEAITGQYFSASLSATNTPKSWAISKASLPPGLNFNTSTGIIYGTPERTEEGNLDQYFAGRSYILYVTATNSGGTSTPKEIKINVWQTPQITTGNTLPNAYTNTPYSTQLYAEGSKKGMSWKLKSGTLPPGLSLDSNCQKIRLSGSRTAKISGTPTRAGTYTFTMEVAAGSENAVELTPPRIKTASKTFTIKVTQPVPVITTTPTSFTTTTGQYFSKTLSATNSPTSWRISGGSLPTGLNFNTSTGAIYGTPTPTEEGKTSHTGVSYHLYVIATNSGGPSNAQEITITVRQSPQITTGSTLPSGIINTSYSKQLYAEGSKMGMSWKLKSGSSLPPGLSLKNDTATGTLGSRTATISGKPTKAGTYTFTMEVAAGSENAVELTPPKEMTASKTFTIKVTQPVISASFSTTGIINTAYSGYATVSGGKAPYTWTKSGTIPPGLTYKVSGAKVTLTGKPTKAGSCTFTLTAKDASGNTVSKSFTIKVTAPAITASFPTGILNTAYSGYATVSGGKAAYTWTKSGTIPPGLTYKASGAKVTLTGKPTKAGSYKFTLTAKDASGNTVNKSFTVKITQSVATKTGNISTLDTKLEGNELEKLPNTSKVRMLSNKVTKLVYVPVDDTPISTPDTTNTIKKLSITTTALYVASEDILWQGEDHDEDLVEVKANTPVTFVIGEWLDDSGAEIEVFDVQIYVNGEFAEDIFVSEENTFTIPADIAQDDFRVYVKAQGKDIEVLSTELFISVIR